MNYTTYIKPRKRSNTEVILPKSFYVKRLKLGLFSIIPIFIIFIVLYLIFLLIFKSSVFNLEAEKIEINGVGNFVNERDFKNKVLSYTVDKNITKLNTSEIEKNLVIDFPSLKSVKVEKSLPPYLVVTAEERKPFFSVYKENKDDSYMVASDGFILGKVNDRYKDLFKVQYSDEIKEGTYINVEILNLYEEILKAIDVVNLTLDHIVFDKDNTSIYLSNNVVVFISNKKGVQDSFKIVKSIIDKLNGEEKKVSKIDLRYEKVIVSYN